MWRCAIRLAPLASHLLLCRLQATVLPWLSLGTPTVYADTPSLITSIPAAHHTVCGWPWVCSIFLTLTSSPCSSYTYVTTFTPWISIRTKDGTASSSSLSAGLKAPVAEPGLMKSLPSTHRWVHGRPRVWGRHGWTRGRGQGLLLHEAGEGCTGRSHLTRRQRSGVCAHSQRYRSPAAAA